MSPHPTPRRRHPHAAGRDAAPRHRDDASRRRWSSALAVVAALALSSAVAVPLWVAASPPANGAPQTDDGPAPASDEAAAGHDARDTTASEQRLAGSVADVVVVGGPAAVSENVARDAARATGNGVQRVAGDDRYATAAEVAAESHPDGADTVYLATGEDFPDALAVAAVAAAGDPAPVLLTATSTLPEATAEELQRLAPDEVVVAGGPAAVDDAAAEDAARVAGDAALTRVGGDDRYHTAARIADELLDGDADTVFLATGEDFPDALAAAVAAADDAAPVLLTASSTLPEATADALRRREPDSVVVVGGPAAVDDATAEEAARVAGDADLTRVGGDDRYHTAARIADELVDGQEAPPVLATGEDFPDALAAAPLAAAQDRAVMVTPTRQANGTVIGALTGTAAPRVNYFLTPHPDDEMATWALAADRADRGDYNVFVLLTRGEASSMCDGRHLNPEVGDRTPQPEGFEGRFTDTCAAQRVDSWDYFLDHAGAGEVGDLQSSQGAPVDGLDDPARPVGGDRDTLEAAWEFDYAVGEDSARFYFHLGDGDLTRDEVLWALETVRDHRDELPVDGPEGDVVAAAYFNDDEDDRDALVYDHPDHRAVYEAVLDVDHRVPGGQYAAVSPNDPDASTVYELDDDVYDALMGVEDATGDPRTGPVDGQRTGVFQRSYGWLTATYWPFADTAEPHVAGGFARVQYFAERSQ